MNAPDIGADVGHAANAGAGQDPPDQTRLRQLADEQAALRRVATLVASRARPAEVFSAVADELGRLICAEATFVCSVDLCDAGRAAPPAADACEERGELEGYTTVVGSYGRTNSSAPVRGRICCSVSKTWSGVPHVRSKPFCVRRTLAPVAHSDFAIRRPGWRSAT
jgi:hypothetical protein